MNEAEVILAKQAISVKQMPKKCQECYSQVIFYLKLGNYHW